MADGTGARRFLVYRDTVVPIVRRAPASPVTTLSAMLDAVGIHLALQHLNACGRFRFTGVFHVDPPLLRTLHAFDRENPTIELSGTVQPLQVSACALVGARHATRPVNAARHDRRLIPHAVPRGVLSCCGVPLCTASGRTWGTLCHYDLRPRLLREAEREILDDVAPIFSRWFAGRGTFASAT